MRQGSHPSNVPGDGTSWIFRPPAAPSEAHQPYSWHDCFLLEKREDSPSALYYILSQIENYSQILKLVKRP